MALHLGDLSEANGGFPVVTHNWKSIRDKKIYGNDDLPEQAVKNVGSGIRGGGGRHAPVYLKLSLSSRAAAATALAPPPSPRLTHS